MSERLPQLVMALASLDHVPPVEVADGYRLRAYQPGDEAAWCDLVNGCIGGEYTEEQCRRDILETPGFEAGDLFFAERDGEVVGTAWALRKQRPEEGPGYLHMVAVLAEHRGHRLGRALVLAALHRFRELGYRSAVLQTDDWRSAAIKTYLGLGFRPRHTDPSHEGRWAEVMGSLGAK